jgi:hypothetical protein
MIMSMPESYKIHIKEHLSKESMWFEDLSICHNSDGETILSGSLDQAALHGVLMRIRDLGLTIISVNSQTPDNQKENE